MSGHFEFYAHAGVRKWFLLALLFGCLSLAFTVLYASGVMNRATLEFERWLIGRPLTQFDCVLVEWRNFGAASFNLIFIALVGIICGLTLSLACIAVPAYPDPDQYRNRRNR